MSPHTTVTRQLPSCTLLAAVLAIALIGDSQPVRAQGGSLPQRPLSAQPEPRQPMGSASDSPAYPSAIRPGDVHNARSESAGRTPLPSSSRSPGRSKTASDRKTQTGGPWWSTLGALSFILVLLVVAARLLKKHGPAAAVGLPPEVLELLGKRYVDPRNSIHFVRCGSRILVLGLSPNGFQTLAEITDPLEVSELAGACRRHRNDSTIAHSFRTLFQKQAEADERNDGDPITVSDVPAAHRFRYDAPSPTSIHSAGPSLEERHG